MRPFSTNAKASPDMILGQRDAHPFGPAAQRGNRRRRILVATGPAFASAASRCPSIRSMSWHPAVRATSVDLRVPLGERSQQFRRLRQRVRAVGAFHRIALALTAQALVPVDIGVSSRAIAIRWWKLARPRLAPGCWRRCSSAVFSNPFSSSTIACRNALAPRTSEHRVSRRCPTPRSATLPSQLHQPALHANLHQARTSARFALAKSSTAARACSHRPSRFSGGDCNASSTRVRDSSIVKSSAVFRHFRSPRRGARGKIFRPMRTIAVAAAHRGIARHRNRHERIRQSTRPAPRKIRGQVGRTASAHRIRLA